MEIELANLADVVGLVDLVDEGMNVWHQGHGGSVPVLVFAGVDDLPTGCGRVVEGSGKCGGLSLVHPYVLLEAQALAIGEEQGLGEQERGAGEDGGTVRGGHLLLGKFHHFGVFDEALAHGLEDVVHHDSSGLAFGDGIAGGVELVFGEVVGVAG